MANYYLVALGAVVLTAVSQVMMKQGAHSAGSITWRLYLNPLTLTAYTILVVVTLMNLYAYKVVPLKVGLVLLPLTLLLVMIFSIWLLHERLTRKQVLGAIVTLAGLAVFNL